MIDRYFTFTHQFRINRAEELNNALKKGEVGAKHVTPVKNMKADIYTIGNAHVWVYTALGDYDVRIISESEEEKDRIISTLESLAGSELKEVKLNNITK